MIPASDLRKAMGRIHQIDMVHTLRDRLQERATTAEQAREWHYRLAVVCYQAQREVQW